MIRNKAFKYRLYPNRAKEKLIQKTFGCVRYVYNHFLEERITAYKENGESRTFFQQNKSLTVLKQEHDWLREPDKNALQCAIRDLNTAYQNFFRGCKKGTGFPKFKSKKNDRKSYSTAANGKQIRIEGNGIKFPKLGFVKAKISRDIPEGYRILSATISQNASGKYFVSVLTEYEVDIPEREIEKALGLDYSSPHF